MARWSRMGLRAARGVASAGAGLFLLLAGSPSRAGEVVEYYHLDAIGNVRAVTNAAGQVVERHDYLPFGEEWCPGPPAGLCASVTPGQPKRFTGKERDAETGLDYFGARYYASKIGRFTTVDPAYNWNANLVDPQRWNRYAYGRNNPLRYVDPDGRDIFDYFGGVVSAFGSNLAFGYGRPTGGNADFRFGQAVGDALSLAAASAEAKLGGGLVVGGAAATGTGVLAEAGVPAAVVGVVVAGHAATVATSATVHLSKNTLSPGEHAGESIPARGPQRDFNAGERAEINRIGGETGCHTCGSTQAGTRSGNFVPDHQPPNGTNQTGAPQRLYPHCINCSRTQGGEVRQAPQKQQ